MTEPKPIYGKPEMPSGLESVVLRILQRHKGLDNAITRPTLLAWCRAENHDVDDRTIRQAIEELRKKGYLVGSSSRHGGYFLCANIQEFEEFAAREYHRKIATMSETVRAMSATAQKEFEQCQMTLL